MSDRDPGPRDWQPWGRPDDAPTEESRSDAPEEPAAEAAWWSPEPERPAADHTRAYEPISGGWAAQPPSGWTHDPSFPPQASPTPSRRRGPGWGAFVGGLVAVGLLAGTTGGLVGGFLGDRTSGSPVARSAPTPVPGAGATSRPEGSIANIAATTLPSVVTLRVGGGNGRGSTGSGWVYDDAGHVVTNNHVVDGAGDSEITVVLSNGEQVTGRVVGKDASYDLAVVEVDDVQLSPLTLGRSSEVVVGDQVIAVGAPLGLDSTVTTGIVSALDRPVTPGGADDQSFINAIQTDAAINPGNSGGPLLDMTGAVIGVNSAIAQVPGSGLSGPGGNIGVGFAIPSDQVATTVEQLIETGTAEHPIIGVFLDPDYDGEGVRIADSGPDGQPAVNPGGPADAAGLRAGDVIVAFEGRPVTEGGELVVKIRSRRVGDTVTLTVRRGSSDEDVRMVLQGSS